ncbi:MAG TPA: LLM class flavin-dependent oxidoreductase [Acidimicrobiales bacterium]|nr:LLM class flavin-dependent oxidoreductase [Acidimicrobiales bacterium]
MSPTPIVRPPLSVLDLAVVNAGGTTAEALAATTTLAQRAEELGYHRFWVAEHHNMPLVASTTPPVLMAHLAARTTRIRIGSGGIMLPNHAPLVVAEHVAALEALHPGRIDLGLGRAPGTNQETALALRRSLDLLGAEDFPRDLLDLMGLLGDRRGEGGLWDRFSATPVATSTPQILLLGSSGFSAQLAGRLGLPFVFAHHFDQGGTREAVALYRDSFRPSPVLEQPYVIVTASVLVAATDEEAQWEAGPSMLMVHHIRYGRFGPLVSPEEAAADPNTAVARALPSNRIVGSPETVVAALDGLVAHTGADEIMVSTVAHGLDTRRRSLELLAEAWASPSVLPAPPVDELVQGDAG